MIIKHSCYGYSPLPLTLIVQPPDPAKSTEILKVSPILRAVVKVKIISIGSLNVPVQPGSTMYVGGDTAGEILSVKFPNVIDFKFGAP